MPTDAETAKINQWKKNERSAKSLLTQKLPDSTLMRVHSKKTVRERWEAIVAEYTQKGAFAQTEMRAKFLGMKCPEKGNAREFLDSLRVKKEELATLGVSIDNRDYLSTIITSLPYALANFASNQLASARLYASDKTISPDALISMISEESDRQRAQRAANPRSPKKDTRGDGKDEALIASSSSTKKFKPKPKGACWNCGEVGHLKNKCPKPKDSQSSSGNANSANSANAAISDSEEEGAFFMEPDSEDDSDEIVILNSRGDDDDGCTSSSDESDGAKSGWETEELSGVDWSETSSLVDVDLDSVAAQAEELVARADETVKNEICTEIIDSGCSRHLTPHRNSLTNYVEIEPKLFRAANKRNMKAVGMGKMSIDVPNGNRSSKLELIEVLYTPEVGYTLVSTVFYLH
ncbi:hypothetical protein AX14_009429 [Amanita brunnescens Koide BX004]|nr:hypothetical protein AX14_009429 [Amanita brunnescens Koide BX004]